MDKSNLSKVEQRIALIMNRSTIDTSYVDAYLIFANDLTIGTYDFGLTTLPYGRGEREQIIIQAPVYDSNGNLLTTSSELVETSKIGGLIEGILPPN